MNPIVIGKMSNSKKSLMIECPFCGEEHIHEIPSEELNSGELGYVMSKCENIFIRASYYIIFID